MINHQTAVCVCVLCRQEAPPSSISVCGKTSQTLLCIGCLEKMKKAYFLFYFILFCLFSLRIKFECYPFGVRLKLTEVNVRGPDLAGDEILNT